MFKLNSKLFIFSLLLFVLFVFLDSSSFAHGLIIPPAAKQGQTIEVIVQMDNSNGENENLSATGPKITFNGHAYTTYLENAERARALIVIPATLKPNTYIITSAGAESKIKVVSANFPVQRISLPSTKDNFIMSPGEEEAVDKAKATESPERLWKGKFVVPSKARVSAKYGLRRIVNGKLLDDYFHSGLDYAGSLGSPVYAAQNGKVVLAHKGWRLHGNIICIDHGQGVLSFYIHLKDILVKQGQLVDAGQLIGKVGQTGRANGPHLHFSVYVSKDAANPQDWFTKVF